MKAVIFEHWSPSEWSRGEALTTTHTHVHTHTLHTHTAALTRRDQDSRYQLTQVEI